MSRRALHTRLVPVLLLATAIISVAGAAAQTAPIVQISGTETSDHQLRISVSAIDDAGNPLLGLGADAFTVTIDGTAVPVSAAEQGLGAGLPLALVLAIDTSGSMAGEPLAQAKVAAGLLIDALQPGDRVALVAFASEVTTVVELTSDAAALRAGLEGLTATGNTALYDGTGVAIDLAAAAPEPRTAVILMSDGAEFGGVSERTREAVIGQAESVGVAFFAVALGPAADAEFLTSVAGQRGSVAIASSSADLPDFYSRISERLRAEYRLAVALPADLAGGEHTVEVAVGGTSATDRFATPLPEPADNEPAETVPPPAASPVFAGLGAGAISSPVTVTVTGLPSGTNVSFVLDGEPIAGASDSSADIDPLALTAGRHALEARWTGPGGAGSLAGDIEIAQLEPRIIAPTSLDGFRPADVIRVAVAAQPGPLTVSLLVDGTEAAASSDLPFDLRIPPDLPEGRHEIQLVADASGRQGTSTLTLDVAASGGTSGLAIAVGVVFALLALLLVLGIVYRTARGGGLHLPRRQPQQSAPEMAALMRAVRTAPTAAEPALPARPQAQAYWGTLRVIEGPDRGREWHLGDEVELVGRSSACSVQLKDPGVAKEHFVIHRDGRFYTSVPTNTVEVGGARVSRGHLRHGDQVRIGATTMEFLLSRAAPQGRFFETARGPEAPR